MSDRVFREHDEWVAKQEKYRWINEQYFSNITTLPEAWSKLIKANDFTSAKAKKYMKRCIDAIILSEGIRVASLDISGVEPLTYPAFGYLAKFFEKRGEFDKAIEVCEDAIARGFVHDGTKGGMQGRIERLKRKIGKG